jgi:hypothetical protein
LCLRGIKTFKKKSSYRRRGKRLKWFKRFKCATLIGRKGLRFTYRRARLMSVYLYLTLMRLNLTLSVEKSSRNQYFLKKNPN